MHKEGELSREPGKEKEEKRLREEAEEARDTERSFARQNAEMAKDIQRSVDALSVETFHSEALDKTQNKAAHISAEGFAEVESNTEMDSLLKKRKTVMDKVKESDPESKNWNTKRFLAKCLALTTISGGVLALLFELAYRDANGKSSDDIDSIPDDEKEKISELLEKWKSQSDSDYWNSLANFVDSNNEDFRLSIADQILFMNYTIEYSPCITPWIWDKTQDKVDKVNQLIDVYNKNGSKTSAMFRAVTTIIYNGTPLPRAISADILSLALSWIIQD